MSVKSVLYWYHRKARKITKGFSAPSEILSVRFTSVISFILIFLQMPSVWAVFVLYLIRKGGEVMPLTKKQERFCEEYLIDLNATQAYIRAGYSAKSNDIARVESSKLLTKPNIQQRIK